MYIIGHVSLVLTGLQEFPYVSSEYLGSDALIRVGGLMQRTMREGFLKIGAFFSKRQNPYISEVIRSWQNRL